MKMPYSRVDAAEAQSAILSELAILSNGGDRHYNPSEVLSDRIKTRTGQVIFPIDIEYLLGLVPDKVEVMETNGGRGYRAARIKPSVTSPGAL